MIKPIGKSVVCGLTVVFLSIQLVGCKSTDLWQHLTAEERFELGMQAFNNRDYLDAIEHFTAVTVQFAGSHVADDAQFYLGEARFRRGEYLLAAHEYETLRRNMPASPFAPIAQYHIGLSYYRLAPESALDQRYSKKTIEELQTFIEYYPTHELVPDAEAKIRELNDRLAKKDYDTAVLYKRMGYYRAAQFYFESVLEKYHDSAFAERSYVGKIEALVARRRFEEARVETEKFLARFPESPHRSTIESIQENLDRTLKDRSALGGESPGGGVEW